MSHRLMCTQIKITWPMQVQSRYKVEGHLEYRICAVALDPRHPLGVQCREYEKSLRPLLLQKVADVILNSIIHCEVVICFI